MINPLKVLLFLAGGTAVAAAGAYVSGALDPLFTDEPQAVAILPAESGAADEAKPADPAAPKEDRVEQAAGATPAADAQAPATDEPTGQPPTTADAAPPAEQPDAAAAQPEEPAAEKPADVAAADPQAPAAEPSPEPAAPAAGGTLPTFDVLRVEPDGSMVIAGKAAPNSKIELLAKGVVIGGTTTDSSGDFVAVLDEPLAPGDYQITIRATKPDSAVEESAQTAIVSIPAEAGGQVLAMVEEPGKPSEIITVPQPAVASADAAGEAKPDQVAAADPEDAGGQPVAADPAKPAEGAASDAAPVQDGAPADAAKPDQAGTTAGETQQPADGPEVAAADAVPEKPAADSPAAPSIDVAVEAVEIDGSKVFVAGRAPAGSTVRVYANDILLGDATASAAGRFLVEADQDLPVGNYVVRADVLGPNGGDVIARAAVPFVREPGENIAAVAAPAENVPAEQKPADAAASEPAADAPADQPPAADTLADQPPAVADATPPAAASETAADDQAGPAATSEEAVPAADEKPSVPASVAEAPAADVQAASPAGVGTETPPAEEQVLPAAVAEAPADNGDAEPVGTAETDPAGEAGDTIEPADTAEAPASDAQPPAAGQPAEIAETATPPPAGTQAPAEPAAPTGTAEASPPAAGGQPADSEPTVVAVAPPVEVTAPPLQKVDGAVIIRRGDTLWRISRRVYGRGVRYSTIYLANQDQIRDPDLIWPGQVFTVPDTTSEGETADMSRMGEQVVPKAQ